jgi:23S rRNA pseudouridine1911/1915/1917 synthase
MKISDTVYLIMQKISPENSTGERIDSWLHKTYPEKSRSMWKKHLISGEVRVNKQKITPHYKLHENDQITIDLIPVSSQLIPEDIPLDIVFEDDNYAVINKSAGLVVHPGTGNPTHTLAHALLFHFQKNLSDLSGTNRPGIVHRLDKDTSGLIIIAKTNKAHQHLAKQFEKHQIKKVYKTLVGGHIKPKNGTINAPLNRSETHRQKISVTSRPGSRHAITHYEVKEAFSEPFPSSLLEIIIETGRTHQIRVHLSSIGFPVFGDKQYGKRSMNQAAKELGLTRQFLHAHTLSFLSPTTEKEVTYTAPLPQELQQFLTQLS